MLADRRRMMAKPINYEHVSSVWISANASSVSGIYPYGTIDLKPFTVNCASYEHYFEVYVESIKLRFAIEPCVGQKLQGGVDFSNQQYNQFQANDSGITFLNCGTREKVNTSAVDGTYSYNIHTGSNNITKVSVHLSGTDSVLITSPYTIENIGWPGTGSKSNYLTWKQRYDGTEFSQYIFKFYINSSSGTAKTPRFKLSRISNNGIVVANIIPVKFKNTGRYGLLDTISGNYIDSVASGNRVFYFSGE